MQLSATAERRRLRKAHPAPPRLTRASAGPYRSVTSRRCARGLSLPAAAAAAHERVCASAKRSRVCSERGLMLHAPPNPDRHRRTPTMHARVAAWTRKSQGRRVNSRASQCRFSANTLTRAWLGARDARSSLSLHVVLRVHALHVVTGAHALHVARGAHALRRATSSAPDTRATRALHSTGARVSRLTGPATPALGRVRCISAVAAAPPPSPRRR